MIRLALIVAALGVALSQHRPAIADHLEFMAEDLQEGPFGPQIPDIPGPENYVFLFWGYGSGMLSWRADADVRTNAREAIANWTTAVPQLTWRELQAGEPDSNADVLFKVQAIHPACLPSAVACTAFTSWFPDSIRRGNYWDEALVTFNVNYNWRQRHLRGIVAHEIGHLYGLHERYPDNPPTGACNNGENTIMDGTTFDQQGRVVHCDGIEGPVTLDEQRVTRFWSQGELVGMAATATGTVAAYTWRDRAWSDYEQRLEWFYWDGSAFLLYAQKSKTTDIGTHEVTEPRTLREDIDRTFYGAPGGVTHRMCGQPYFIKYGSLGTRSCVDVFMGDVAAGLVGYWKFDEGSGSSAADASGNGNTGTLQPTGSGPTWQSGAACKSGSCLLFDGLDDFVNVANEFNFDFERTNPFSIALWVKPNVADTSIQTPVAKMRIAAPMRGWNFTTNYDGNFGRNPAPGFIGFQLAGDWDAGNRIAVYSSAVTNLNNGSWHHYVVTCDGSSTAAGIKIHQDGQPLPITTQFDNLTLSMLNDINVFLGSRDTHDFGPYAGHSDQNRIYNRALSASEVLDLYNSGQ